MKIYISADIEGVTGISNWNETLKSHEDYSKFAKQLTSEVSAACYGAINAGTAEILVRDAHDSARNIDFYSLPENVILMKGFNGHPFCMMQGIDDSFDAAIMIGYHSYASSPDNPLSHTLNPNINYIKINDKLASEFTINAYTAAYVGVPVVFISGDEGICTQARDINPNITALAVNKGIGSSVVSIHPKLTIDTIKLQVEKILKNDLSNCKIILPNYFKVEINYKNHTDAYKNSFYPGVQLINSTTLQYESKDYFDVLTLLSFIA